MAGHEENEAIIASNGSETAAQGTDVDPHGAGDDAGIHVTDDVIATLAAHAALEVPELVGFSGGLVGDLTKMLGKSSVGRGVRVHRDEPGLTLDLHVIVRYGARIPRLAHRVQERVKAEVEGETRLPVTAVNIHVQAIEAHADALPSLAPDEGGG